MLYFLQTDKVSDLDRRMHVNEDRNINEHYREEYPAMIFDRSDGQDLRINTIGSWLRREFGIKMVKLSIDAGFTCPNRDGTKGRGGCLFCSSAGSGDHASSLCSSEGSDNIDQADLIEKIRYAIDSQVDLLRPKWPDAGYIAYFQSNTNTYGPADRLQFLYETVLDQPDISGVAIATRPDCLSGEVLDLLEELNHKTFLWVEMGLQTIHEKTMKDMNLCYSLEDYSMAVTELTRRGIRIVTHLMFGLPGEDRDMMLDSVRYVCRPTDHSGGTIHSGRQMPDKTYIPGSTQIPNHIFGLKLHMLNVVRDSALPNRYPGYVPFESIDEYTDLIVDILEMIPPDITIHRLYADAPMETLIAPTWARQKRLVLNEINKKLRDRDSWQGKKSE